MSPAPTRAQRIGAFIVLSLAIVLVFAPLAWSQGHDHGHGMHHDHYRNWMRPTTPWIPCCNAKEVTPDGRVSGDCYPTAAEVRNGAWWARRDTGEWIEIADERLVRYPNPDPTGRDAHLCEISGVVFCFRPPVGGT